MKRGVEAGFDHHLNKPINFQALQSLLEKIEAPTAAIYRSRSGRTVETGS